MPRAINRGVIASFLLLLTANVVMLDLMVFWGRNVRQSDEGATSARVTEAPSPAQPCVPSCEAKIDALARMVDALTASRSGAARSSPVVASSRAKEYYIPLGSGTTKRATWQELVGVEAVVDTRNYPPIQTVIFEVYLAIPTANGTVRAKLYNATDKHDVWFSEVSSEGPILTKREAPITLDQGAKTYRVMGLSTLSYDARIENARLRIVTY